MSIPTVSKAPKSEGKELQTNIIISLLAVPVLMLGQFALLSALQVGPGTFNPFSQG